MNINSTTHGSMTTETGITSHSSGKSLFKSLKDQLTGCFKPVHDTQQSPIPGLSSKYAQALSQGYSGSSHTQGVPRRHPPRQEDPRLSDTPMKQALASMIDREHRRLESRSQNMFKSIAPAKSMIEEALARKDKNPKAACFSDDEFLAVHLFSTHLYRPINHHLRHQPQEDAAPVVEALKRGMAKLAEVPEHQVRTTLYRGFEDSISDSEVAHLFQSVRPYRDKAFMSTSTDRDIADGMTHQVQLRIESSSAVSIKDFSKFPGEQEALIPPNTPFDVVHMEKQSDIWHIDLRETLDIAGSGGRPDTDYQ